MQSLLTLDGNILLMIQNNIRSPFLTAILRPITHLGDKGLFWIILTLALLAFKKTRPLGICSMMALLCSVCVNNLLLKHIVNRTRPYELVEGLHILVGKPDDASFPSGHSAASFASAIAICFSLHIVGDEKKLRIWGVLAVVLAALIALSRLYVGVHYPTDVICGTASGILCGVAGYHIGLAIMRKVKKSRPALLEEDADLS